MSMGWRRRIQWGKIETRGKRVGIQRKTAKTRGHLKSGMES